MKKKRLIRYKKFIALLLTVSGLILYSSTINSEFHFDDIAGIVAKERITTLKTFAGWTYWTDLENRPLSELTFAINYQLGKFDVTGYHLVNILIHILNAWLVYLLSLLLLSGRTGIDKRMAPDRYFIALFIALIFLVHPIQTQAVSYTIQRMTSLSSLFYLLAVYLYLAGRKAYLEKGRLKRSIVFIFLACVSGMLGILAKQDAVTFPAAFLMVELLFIRNKNGKPCLKYSITALSLLGAVLIAIIATGHLPSETDTISRGDYLLTQFRVILKYIQLLILPVNQVLDYDFRLSTSLWNFGVIAGLLAILLLLGLSVLLLRRQRMISFGILWFFLTLLVSSSIIPISDVIFEHRLYLPMFGFSAILVYTLGYYLIEKRRKLLWWTLVLLTLVYAAASLNRNTVWESEYSLWKDVTDKSPQNPRAWSNLGFELLKKGEVDQAVESFNRSLALDPKYTNALNNLGYIHHQRGDLQTALNYFEKAYQSDTNFTDAMNNCGKVLVYLDRPAEAAGYFQKAINTNPSLENSYYNMAIALIRMDSLDRAIGYLQECLARKPEEVDAMKKLGQCYLETGKYEDAIPAFRNVLRLTPRDAATANDLGIAYEKSGDLQQAMDSYQLALKITPGYEPARANLERINQLP